MNADRDAIAGLLGEMETATMQERDDELAAFLVQCWPTLAAQNN